ncbi:hypothetical protein IL306_008086, partial [Fusarium sp. DS 682]
YPQPPASIIIQQRLSSTPNYLSSMATNTITTNTMATVTMDHYAKDLTCTDCIGLAASVANLEHALALTKIEMRRRELKNPGSDTAQFQFEKKDIRIMKLEAYVHQAQEAEIKAAEAAYEECKEHLEMLQDLDCKDLDVKSDKCARLEEDLQARMLRIEEAKKRQLEYLINFRYAED